MRRILCHQTGEKGQTLGSAHNEDDASLLRSAGLVLLSVFFLMPPWKTAKVVLGVAPLVFLVAVGIAVYRARSRADESNRKEESGE